MERETETNKEGGKKGSKRIVGGRTKGKKLTTDRGGSVHLTEEEKSAPFNSLILSTTTKHKKKGKRE